MFREDCLKIEKGLDVDCDISQFENEYVYYCKTNSYIVKHRDIIYGFYRVTLMKDFLILDYALVKNLRGIKFGRYFLELLFDVVAKENPEIKKVVLLINNSNESSMKVSMKEKFSLDYELVDFVNEELKNHTPYSKANPYYESEKVKQKI